MMLAHNIYNESLNDKSGVGIKKLKMESVEISESSKKLDSEKENELHNESAPQAAPSINYLFKTDFYPSHLYASHFASHSNRASPNHSMQNASHTTRCPSTPAFSSSVAENMNCHLPAFGTRKEPVPYAVPYHQHQYAYNSHPSNANNFFLFTNNYENANNLNNNTHSVYKNVNSASYASYSNNNNNSQNFGKKKNSKKMSP